jgi:hypothetical protein
MQGIAKTIGLLSLAATIVPAILFMFHIIGLAPVKYIMFFAAIAWFGAAPYWMKTE